MSFGNFACIAAAIQMSWAAVVSEGNGDCAALPIEKSAGERAMLQHSMQQASAPALNLDILSNHEEKHQPASLPNSPSALLHTESNAVDFNTPMLLASVLNVSDAKQHIVVNRSSTELKHQAKQNSSQTPQGQQALDGPPQDPPPPEYTFSWVGYGQCIYDRTEACGLCDKTMGELCSTRQGTDCFANLGWTTCNTGIVGGCPGLTACQDYCRETEECGAVDYFKGHCWMFKKVYDARGILRPYHSGNKMVQWYHCWAKTVAQPPPEVSTTTTTTSTGWAGAWFLGEEGKSCNQVCANAGGCYEMMLYELDTELEVQEVANALGAPCDEYIQKGARKEYSPAFRYEELSGEGETYTGRMCYWKPDFRNPGNRNCDAKAERYIRICPCNDASFATA